MPSEFSLENLPKLIKEHINKPSLSDKYVALFSEISLEQTRPLNKLIWQVYHREINLVDFLQKAQAINLPRFKESIFPGILVFDFFPIADYLQIKISDWLKFLNQKEQANLKVVSLSEWIKRDLGDEGLELGERAINRLKDILEEFLVGKKREDEIVDCLTREEKIGGIELAEDAAERILEEFKKRLQKAWDNDEILTIQEVQIEKQPVFPQASQSPKKQSDKGLLREMSQPTIPPLPTIQNYEQAAKEIIEKSGIKVAIDLEPRFKSILVSGLKEVRKIIEVRERLAADPKIGGLGLNPEEAEKILQLIEEGKKKISSGELEPVEKKIEAEAPARVLPAPVKPSIKKEEPRLEDLVIQAEPPKLKPKAFEPAIKQPLSPPVFTPISKMVLPTSSDIKIGQAPAIKIIPQKKNEAKVELSPIPPMPPKPPITNAVPQTLQGRAKVEDVKFRLRLIGPIEELQEMTLLDFHRLSPKPKVALDKIRTKIELLEKEGYAKRILGIQSWQKSPLNQMYLSLLNDGIKKGLPIKQLLEEKRKTNQEILTAEEFQEIMEFNRSLRF